MFVRLKLFLSKIQSGLWFIPTLIAILAFGIALLLEHFDLQRVGDDDYLFGIGFTDAAGARSILTAIASASITVAGVVFSITMAVLASASAQYGPRLLRNFLTERSTKVVLGLFIGTFVYCITVALSINAANDASWIPQFSVAGGCLVGLSAFGALIYFIHRVATFIQASEIIDDVIVTLEAHIGNLFPLNALRERELLDPAEGRSMDPTSLGGTSIDVISKTNGYVQALGLDSMINLAIENDLLIRIETRPGKAALPGGLVARFWHHADQEISEDKKAGINEKILGEIITGPARTPDQDFEFAIDQLVEIAVRALSPGINDPFTAIACIDRLSGVLAVVGTSTLPSGMLHDDEGKLRVAVKPYDHAGIADSAFHRLRQHGRRDTSVAIALLDAMLRLHALTKLKADFRHAIIRHIKLLLDEMKAQNDIHPSDFEEFNLRIKRSKIELSDD